jgi:hypothetical protein
MPSDPFTWEDSVEKFDRLVAGRADESVSREIKDVVRSLESIQDKDLMQLLGCVTSGKRTTPKKALPDGGGLSPQGVLSSLAPPRRPHRRPARPHLLHRHSSP